MSRENVDAFRRALEATNRRDAEALCEELDPEVEWHPAMAALLGGGAMVYRGHEGVREWMRDVDEAFVTIHAEFPEILDVGDRILAVGCLRMRGKASGAETESPLAYTLEFKNGKAIRVRTYLDHQEALAPAGLSE